MTFKLKQSKMSKETEETIIEKIVIFYIEGMSITILNKYIHTASYFRLAF